MSVQHIRFIHCADLHLDSRMESHLTHFQAQNRRKELLRTFSRMTDYANCHNVRAILISGDLFDTVRVAPSSVEAFLNCITEYPQIDFLYLPGNHDNHVLPQLSLEMNWPDNLFLLQSENLNPPDFQNSESFKFQNQENSDFQNSESSEIQNPERPESQSFEKYSKNQEHSVSENQILHHTIMQKTYKQVIITGLTGDISQLPPLSPSRINLVMLHGQLFRHTVSSESIIDNIFNYSLKDFAGRNIDYIAAGHIHQYQTGSIDSRGTYCYSGCLEGRGFDECGEKGFVLLDIFGDDTNDSAEGWQIQFQFVPFASRQLYDLNLDVTGCTDYRLAWQQADELFSSIDSAHLVRLKLTGRILPDLNLHTDWLLQKYMDDFYLLIIEDLTRPEIFYEDYRYDISLKGEFIRLVLSDSNLKEEEKEKIIMEGLHALAGEEIRLN